MMADSYTLVACWGDWYYTTTQSNLNGRIDCEGRHSGGDTETLHWTLENNGDSIVWTDEGGRWNLTLRRIGNDVWQANGRHGSHPYLVIYKH
jgi:hypothetical protein